MSTMVQSPVPTSQTMVQPNPLSPHKSTTRHKPKNTGSGGPRQPRATQALKVNNQHSTPGAEATPSVSKTVVPVASAAPTTGVAKTAKPKNPRHYKKKTTPKPAPSSDNDKGNAGTSSIAEKNVAGVSETPAVALEVQNPQPIANGVGDDGKRAGPTAEAKAAKSALQKAVKKESKGKKKEEHFNLVLSAARATIAALQKHGLPCAVFGSLACKLYHGSARYPKDVDLLVLQPPSPNPDKPARTAEQVKSLMLDTNPRHFFLKLPRDPEATYRILYYREEYLGPECKVDILLPGTMHLPYIPPTHEPSAGGSSSNSSPRKPAPNPVIPGAPLIPLATTIPSPSPRNHVTTISGIPLVPFSLLLLHKLQGWDDHRIAPEAYKQRKQVQDAADLRRLFTMDEMIRELQQLQPWADPELFSEEFQELTKARVKEFCKAFPTRATEWQSLGFDTVLDVREHEGETL